METLNIIKEKYLAQPRYRIAYSNNSDAKWVTLPPGIPTRDQVINAVITEEYPRDRMEAVVNNYLLDMTDAQAKAEFDVMQAFRREAKLLADEVIAEIGRLYHEPDSSENETA